MLGGAELRGSITLRAAVLYTPFAISAPFKARLCVTDKSKFGCSVVLALNIRVSLPSAMFCETMMRALVFLIR